MTPPVVILATRGRASEAAELLRLLERQSLLPDRVIVVGAAEADLPQVNGLNFLLELRLAPMPGLTRQRNVGVAAAAEAGLLNDRRFLVFFDDDFRPGLDWLAAAAAAFDSAPSLAGLTGRVLADGVKGKAITEEEAQRYLSRRSSGHRHWANTEIGRPVESLYGCNMAVRAELAEACAFDEGLPAYGWQEDCDYTGQLRRLGETRLHPACLGVHLGVKSARTSGLRMGYSQIANPIRINRRGNMPALRMLRFTLRALAANIVKSLPPPGPIDFRGRLRGNLRALRDLLIGRCDPERILLPPF